MDTPSVSEVCCFRKEEKHLNESRFRPLNRMRYGASKHTGAAWSAST